jgi:signal transduction histidine kinase
MAWLDALRRLRVARAPVRYAGAAVVVLIGLAVGIASEGRLPEAPSAPLFAAVLLIAWLFGFGPATLAAAVGGVALRSLDDAGTAWHFDRRDTSWLLLFVVTVLAMAWLASSIRRLEDERGHLLARERAARAEAEEASRAKDRFLVYASHELKTPLGVILDWLHLLRNGKLSDEQIPAALDTIERNTRLQAKLVADLLDVARAARGKETDIARRTVDIPEVVRHVVEAHQPQAQAGGVTLVSHGQGGTTVLGDPDRLQQVVSNLICNAMKFTPAGGHVHVAVTSDAEMARIVVRDTGEGIDGTILPHIFEAFRQGEPGRRRPDGMGLGLAIAKHIVELHGGTIRARSGGPDRGATFIVELPRVA